MLTKLAFLHLQRLIVAWKQDECQERNKINFGSPFRLVVMPIEVRRSSLSTLEN